MRISDWSSDVCSSDLFTFLGCIETDVVSGDDGRARFEVRSDAALGLARAGKRYADADALIAPREELDKYSESSRLVVITKRSEERRVGKECVSTGRFRGAPDH